VESLDPVEARARARLGQTLRGKYRLDRLLGVGGMAAVYAAVHRNGRPVAVKLLHPELAMHELIRERFLREGQVANAVGHAGAVAVIDDDVADDGAAFLVMELLDGATVESLSERQRLPLAALCAIGIQTLEVLAAAHARGVVHRDIKPANLFVTHAGVVKVLDFGIARLREPGSATATQTGMMLGTPAFMAPEQALGKASQINERTDIWAVGATLFTLCSGAVVHDASTAQEALVKAATTVPRSLATVAPDAPPWFVALVDRALAFESRSRFASASEMRDALASSVDAAAGAAELAALVKAAASAVPAAPVHRLPAPPGGTAVAVVTPLPATRRGRVGVTAVLLALAVGAIGLVLVLRTSEAPAPAAASAPVELAAAPPAPAPKPEPLLEPEPFPSAAPTASAPPAARKPAPPAARAPARALVPPAREASALAESSPPKPAVTSKRDCDPPFRFDASGVKRWKRECF
jgi:eukaryotic-like serine/threonine-protein kinase